MERKIKRNPNIELLRIISMMMVLVLHCLSWGGALDYRSGIQLYVYWWLEALAIVAVDIFVLISGYFLVESKFKVKNVFKVAISGVWIYSVFFTCITMKIDAQGISWSTLLKACVPILTKKYWFVNSYVLMYILSPFINKLIHSLSKKCFNMLIVYFVAFFSIRTTVFPMTWSQDSTGGMGIINFIMLYCIGAWIRLYYKKDEKIAKWLSTYFLMSVLLMLSKVGLIKLGMESLSTKFYSYASPVVIVEAVALFLVFLNKKSMSKKYIIPINKMARHSFSVYIIHFSMISVLFTKVFKLSSYFDNIRTGILAVCISVLIIYITCTIIDVLKCWLFEKIGYALKDTVLNRKYEEICCKWETQINDL